MARRVFYSFHYDADAYRVQQVRQMGVVEGQRLLSSNDWQKVATKGDDAIRDWIEEEMHGKSCVVVLAGSATAGREWVEYEIEKAWADRRGLVVVYIHGLKDNQGARARKGANPLTGFKRIEDGTPLTSIFKAYDPPYTDSKAVYGYIEDNLEEWVEEGIALREQWP